MTEAQEVDLDGEVRLEGLGSRVREMTEAQEVDLHGKLRLQGLGTRFKVSGLGFRIHRSVEVGPSPSSDALRLCRTAEASSYHHDGLQCDVMRTLSSTRKQSWCEAEECSRSWCKAEDSSWCETGDTGTLFQRRRGGERGGMRSGNGGASRGNFASKTQSNAPQSHRIQRTRLSIDSAKACHTQAAKTQPLCSLDHDSDSEVRLQVRLVSSAALKRRCYPLPTSGWRVGMT
eukprot:3575487-Rhodomonas_salina.1